MDRLSINETTTFRWTFEEDVANYRAAGIRALGVWRHKLSDFGEEKGVELLADSDMAVSNLLWAGGFTGSDGRTFRESVEDAAEAVRLAADMKADCLVVYSGARSGHTANHARRLLIEAIRQLLPIAHDLRVTLALEPMHPGCATEWTFLTSVDDALAVIDELDSSEVKLVFDTYHLCHDRAVLGRIEQLAPRIAVVHLGDGREAPRREQNRCRLGEGVLPLAEIIAALESAGYRGYYDVELMGEEIEACDNGELLVQTCEAYQRLSSLAER